jgi:hypothetical protein
MSSRKDYSLTPTRGSRDPLGLLRQVTSEFERMFDEPFLPSFRRPWRAFAAPPAVRVRPYRRVALAGAGPALMRFRGLAEVRARR